MSETTKPEIGNAGTSLATNKSSFDDLFNRDEKQVAKEKKFKMARNGKRLQLIAKINDLNMRHQQAQSTYEDSLINPTADSVAKYIEVKTVETELDIAKKIFSELFPNEVQMGSN